MSSGSATSVDLRGQRRRPRRRARAPAARACRRSPGGRTRPRRGARPSAPPASAPSASSRPPRAKRSAIRWHSRAIRSASAAKKRSLAARARARAARRARSVAARRASRRRAAPAPAARTSQSRHASTPSPVRALTSMRSHARVAPRRGWRRNRSRSKSRCGSRSILLTSTSSQARNISGYLSGLSSPSVTERDHHARVLADPELGRADEVADVLDHQQVELVERQRGQRRADHVRVEVALAAEARRRC